MENLANVKMGVVAVSRDCFPIELAQKRKTNLLESCKNAGIAITDIPVIIENEIHVLKALEEIKKHKVNTLVVYLGNFGPEGPTSLLIQNSSSVR